MIDLDHNATTRPSPAVVEAVVRGLTEFWHNPSSVHRAGQAARAQVELARKEAAALIGAAPREITFTSGGTESIDLGVRGVLGRMARQGGPPVVVSTRVEHAAVRELLEELERRGEARIRWCDTDRAGVIDLAGFERAIDGAALAAIQWANNETGVIQPIREIHARCAARRIPLLCDGMQWVGKEPVAGGGGGLPCDLLAFAPHKFHGPKGVGMLWVRSGVGLAPRIQGTQELGRRGGTENVPGIMGAGVASREAREWLVNAGERARLASLRDEFERGVLAGAPGSLVNAAGAPRLWNTTNIAFPGLEAEALLLMLSERGVNASAGAACSSGSLDPSPVLLAMGIPDRIAHGSLRFSLSRETTQVQVAEAARIVVECVAGLSPPP